MPRLTIIIPFDGDSRTAAFEETLASVLVHRSADTEVIVANAAGYADPWNTAAEGVVFVEPKASGRRNPIDLLNDAIRLSRSDIVHILSPGTEVSEGWTENVLRNFESPETGIVVPCVFDRRKPKRVFALGIRFGRGGTLRTIRRSQFSEEPEEAGQTIIPHISAVFFRKSALRRIGMLNRSFLPQLAYADAALSILEQGWSTAVEPSSRILVRPNLLPASYPFTWGVQIERLYFRWLGRTVSPLSLGEHFASFFIDFGRHFPRTKAFQSLFGRFCGLVFCCETPFALCRKNTPVSRDEEDSPILGGAPFGNGDSATDARKSA